MDQNPIIKQKLIDTYRKIRNDIHVEELSLVELDKLTLNHNNLYNEDKNYLKKLALKQEFNHVCVQWINNFEPLYKKIKFDVNASEEFNNNSKLLKQNKCNGNINKSPIQEKQIFETNLTITDEESDATEFICEMKKYVQSIAKIPRQNLTAKNVSDIRFIINKLHMLV